MADIKTENIKTVMDASAARVGEVNTTPSPAATASPAVTQVTPTPGTPAPTAQASTEAGNAAPNPKPLRIYKQPKYHGGPTNRNKKKKPICPKYTITYLADNITLDRTPAKLGKVEPTKTKFLIKHKNKKDPAAIYMSEREFARAEEAAWNDSKWVSELNKFRAQTFDRVFRRDKTYPEKMCRVQWSASEDLWLETRIRKHASKHGARLKIQDWEKISKAHEKRWVGEKILKGERLAATSKGPSCAKETVEIRRRNASAIRAHFDKSPDLKKLFGQLVQDFNKPGAFEDVSESDDDIDELSDDEEESAPTSSTK